MRKFILNFNVLIKDCLLVYERKYKSKVDKGACQLLVCVLVIIRVILLFLKIEYDVCYFFDQTSSIVATFGLSD